ncbi:MAG: hypothetical protein D6707_06425 [Bacteroidetes bacterium]|nr:MAG: hypothetical protein D6707_06425 [Bacteroidota bacterium]
MINICAFSFNTDRNNFKTFNKSDVGITNKNRVIYSKYKFKSGMELIKLEKFKDDTIYKRNTAEKISTVAFYTVTGFLLFLPIDRYIIHGKKGDDGLGSSLGMFYESLIYGGGSGLVAGIIIVSFDLDKPFRKKHRREKK